MARLPLTCVCLSFPQFLVDSCIGHYSLVVWWIRSKASAALSFFLVLPTARVMANLEVGEQAIFGSQRESQARLTIALVRKESSK